MIAIAGGNASAAVVTPADPPAPSVWSTLLYCLIWFSVLGYLLYLSLKGRGIPGCLMYVILMFFFAIAAMALGYGISPVCGIVFFLVYLVGYPFVRFYLPRIGWGERFLSATIPSLNSTEASWYTTGSMRSSRGPGENGTGISVLTIFGGGGFYGGGASGKW